MKLDELLTEARSKLSDPQMPGSGSTPDSDSLWSDDELVRYLNKAVDEACLRAKLILDRSTTEICQISVVSGTRTYPLDKRVIAVKRLQLANVKSPLTEYSTPDLDEIEPGWEAATGEPDKYLLDYEDGKITFNREPTADDTCTMAVFRYPTKIMSYALRKVQSPEIPEIYHYDLLDWVLHLAYEKQDSETVDKKASARHEALFERRFGPRPTARNQYAHRRRKHHRAKAHFF